MFFYNLINFQGLEKRTQTQHSEAKIDLLGYICISEIKSNNSADDHLIVAIIMCSWKLD